jgi:hypothetical protein
MRSVLIFGVILGFSAEASIRVDGPVPEMNRLVWIWLENTPSSSLENSPFMKSFLRSHAVRRFSHAKPVSPVTQANAVAMISGSDYGIKDNELTRLFNPSLVDLLEGKGVDWKVYAEDFPGSCFLTMGAGNYKRYRVPFLSLNQIESDRYLCMKILNYSNLADDLKNGTIPRVSVLIPNRINSGALGGILTADLALKSMITPFLKNDDLRATTTFIVSTMNLNEGSDQNGFMMIFGNGVNQAGVTSDEVNHYHVLRTIEEGFHLGTLNQEDSKVAPLTGIWE